MKTFSAKPKILKRSIENIVDENVPRKKDSIGFEYDEPLRLQMITSKMEAKLNEAARVVQQDPKFQVKLHSSYPKLQKPQAPSPCLDENDVFGFNETDAPQSKNLDTSFFQDYTVSDPFSIEPIKETQMENPSSGIERIILDSKQTKKQKSSKATFSHVIKNVQEHNLIENVVYCLDGCLHKNFEVRGQGLLDLVDLISKENNFHLIVRAHGFITSIYEMLFKLGQDVNWQSHAAQILMLMLKDEKNCEFLTLDVFSVLVNEIPRLDHLELFCDVISNVKRSSKGSLLITKEVEASINSLLDKIGDQVSLVVKYLGISTNLPISDLFEFLELDDLDCKKMVLQHLTNATHKTCPPFSNEKLGIVANCLLLGSHDISVLSLSVLINLCESKSVDISLLEKIEVNSHDFVEFIMNQFNSLDATRAEAKMLSFYFAIMIGYLARGESTKKIISHNESRRLIDTIQEFIRFQSHLGVFEQDSMSSLKDIISLLEMITE